MQETGFFILFSIPVVIGGAILVFAFRKKRRLSADDVRFFLAKVDELSQKTDSERIIGYDKILDHILGKLGYRWTLADRLKSKPEMIVPHYEEIWRLHKLRNRLVHELENPGGRLEKDAGKYERILRSILEN